MTPEQWKEIEALYRKKGREHAGGLYFKVYYRGLPRATVWGRSLRELQSHLKDQRMRYDFIQQLGGR